MVFKVEQLCVFCTWMNGLVLRLERSDSIVENSWWNPIHVSDEPLQGMQLDFKCEIAFRLKDVNFISSLLLEIPLMEVPEAWTSFDVIFELSHAFGSLCCGFYLSFQIIHPIVHIKQYLSLCMHFAIQLSNLISHRLIFSLTLFNVAIVGRTLL